MVRRPQRSTLTDTILPDTTLFRSVLAAYAEQWPLGLAGPGKGEAQVLARRFQLRVELQGPVEVDDRRLGIAPQQVGEAAVIVEHRGLAVDGKPTDVRSERLIPPAGAVVQQAAPVPGAPPRPVEFCLPAQGQPALP